MITDLKTIEDNFSLLQRGNVDPMIIDLDAEGMANISRFMTLYKSFNINPHEMHPRAVISEEQWEELVGYLDKFDIWHEEESYRTFVMYEEGSMPEFRTDKIYFYIKEWCTCTECGKQIDPFAWPMICDECSAKNDASIQPSNESE